MSNPDLKIRSATLTDADRMVTLCTQLGYPTSSAEIKARLSALKDREDHAVFVAEHLDQIVG
ncbi:MAG: hypothetical protein C4288_02925 [Leptolyngbya sp. ERB_1_1]